MPEVTDLETSKQLLNIFPRLKQLPCGLELPALQGFPSAAAADEVSHTGLREASCRKRLSIKMDLSLTAPDCRSREAFHDETFAPNGRAIGSTVGRKDIL